MKKVSLPPYAPSLIESIRSIGYTLDSAVADIIDNSVSAFSTTIQIMFSPFDDPYIAILDNGSGMLPGELTRAMQHGSTNPLESRSQHDLGRFGLGLKTASLSQCRRLTVASYKDGLLSARCWDLDVILEEEDFVLLELEQPEIDELPLIEELVKESSGTLVVWQHLDKLIEGEASVEAALEDKMDQVRSHLELVFHRYLSGESNIKKIEMKQNGLPLTPLDPFLSNNKSTTPLPAQTVKVEDKTIEIKPFILPHPNKLSQQELDLVGGPDGMRKSQGFYVYRNKRLITWGTWYRLIRQEELSKLARVRVDIPNDLDHLWTLDIKKSSAYPPEVVRKILRQVVERIAEKSKRVNTFRGRKEKKDGLVHVWDRVQGREGISYRINREHPLVTGVLEHGPSNLVKPLSSLLSALESSFPIHAVYADLAQDRKIEQLNEEDTEFIRTMCEELLEVAAKIPGSKEKLLANLGQIEPFSSYPDLVKKVLEEMAYGV